MSLDGDDFGRSSVHQFQDFLVYKCATCKLTHYARLPIQKDFKVRWHAESGRLESFFRHSDYFYAFRNFRNDVFLRTVLHGEPVKWYLQPPRCERIQLCNHTKVQLETYYGPFIRFHSNSEQQQLFNGYEFQRMKDGSVFAYFSYALYNTLECEAQGATGISSTSQSETQCSDNRSSLTGNEIEGRRNELTSEDMLKYPSVRCASFHDLSPIAFPTAGCLDEHRTDTVALQNLDTNSSKENLPPENGNFVNKPDYVPKYSEHSELCDGTNLDKHHERGISLRDTDSKDDHQPSESHGMNEKDTFKYRRPEGEITSHEEEKLISQLQEGSNVYLDEVQDEFQQCGCPECENGRNEDYQQNNQEPVINSSHEDHFDTNQILHADNDSTDPNMCVKTFTHTDGHFHKDVASLNSEECTTKELSLDLADNKNEASCRDVCDHDKRSDKILAGGQRPRPQGESSDVYTDSKATSGYQNRQQNVSKEDKEKRNIEKLTSGRKEDPKPTASADPKHVRQNQNDPSPNYAVNFAHTPSTPDLSKVECLKLNPDSSVDSSVADRKNLNQNKNDSLPNSKVNVVPTLSTRDLTNVEELRLNPDKFIDSFREASSDDLADENMLPLNAEKKLKNQGKLNDYTDKTARDVCTTHRNSTVVMEYKTKPQDSDKPGILDIVVTKTKEVLSGQYSKNQKVFSLIQNSFADWYLGDTNWIRRFPFFFAFHRMPASAIFDFTVKQDGITYTNYTNIFLGMKRSPKKEMLILGSPGFGKTTLCSMIAYRWASRDFGHSELFIHCWLPGIIDNATDLSEAIVFYCKMVLGGKVSDLELIRDALTKYSEHILLLFDGYDQLPENRKREVCNFLTRKDVFSESTIAVTSRPTVDKMFIERFDRLVFIKGFSEYSLRMSMRSIDVPEETITNFMNTIKGRKLDYLFELPPIFTLLAAINIRDSALILSIFSSLYSLLENVIISMVSRKIHEAIDLDNCMQLFHFFGKKCFQHLLIGQCDFDEKILLDTFGSNLKSLLDCYIFYVLSDKDNTQTYQTSGKVLQVFFATMYLRKLWSETKNHKQFLEETFCCKHCFGDFVANEKELYYVGLIPEIVLKFGEDLAIQNATFEMFYDVDRVEHSHAFDSVNLLLRVSDKCLSRYRFLRCVEDNERFGEVLNVIPTVIFFVQHFFYRNLYEEKDFVMIVLREEVEKAEAVLYEVVRAKNDVQVDRIHLDFAFAKLDDLFVFISAQLSNYLDNFNLYENLRYGSMEDFVFELVLQLLECSNLHAAVVRCKGSVDPTKFFVKINCIFKIARQYDKNISNLHFSYEGITAHTFFSENKVYDKSEFFQNKSLMKQYINDCKTNLQNPRISIDIS